MTAINGYKCDGPGCTEFISQKSDSYGYSTGRFNREQAKTWWVLDTLANSNDPHFHSLDCLIAWAEAEKKKPKPKPAPKKKAAPKKKPTSRKKKPARRRGMANYYS